LIKNSNKKDPNYSSSNNAKPMVAHFQTFQVNYVIYKKRIYFILFGFCFLSNDKRLVHKDNSRLDNVIYQKADGVILHVFKDRCTKLTGTEIGNRVNHA
jgi:hypothetical protein